MMREATADLAAGTRSPAEPPASPKAAGPALRVLADNKAPVPVPDSAEDVEFDGADGTLEYHQRIATPKRWRISIARP